MIEVKIPGKLFVAGEYAVTHPGYTAILIAVDRFITLTLEGPSERGSISNYSNFPVSWVRDNGKIILEKEDSSLNYILSAMEVVERYAKELNKSLSCYHIKVDNGLRNEKGVKYGLGSSAAVTVAAVNALLEYYQIEFTEEILFKLSSLANISVNIRGSCGDIAACVYGGWIAYTAFDREWVLEKIKRLTVKELLEVEWPYLKIERLIPPEELVLAIGWTGAPSSTVNLVHKVRNKSLDNGYTYGKFLRESKVCVEKMVDAFRNGNVEGIKRQVGKNRELLVKLGNDLGVEIETPRLKKLCDIAFKYSGSAKPSGAGGGDCGIAIFNGLYDLDLLIEDWEKWGIIYLPLKVYFKKGDSVDKQKG